MEIHILQAFIEEAAEEIPAIRRGLLSFSRSGQPESDLCPPLESVRKIRTGCSMFDMIEVECAAADLEQAIGVIIAGPATDLQTSSTNALDMLAGLEESIVRFHMSVEAPSIDVSAFVDESFDILQFRDDAVDETSTSDRGDELLGFEIDEELLEVFALEAEGLLKNIETSLAEMSRNPADRDALWEIRRNAHTFKGAAGIVGLKKPSKLAHRIEDLLDRMSERGTVATAEVFDVLRHSTEALKAMTNSDKSEQLDRRVAEAYTEFDRVLEALAAPAVETAEKNSEQTIAGAEIDFRSSAKSEFDIKPVREKRSIVRVPLKSLDDLVRITRDLLIGRSVFEQRLKDLEQQIDELHNATRRLQNTSSKLEIDFEASMLGAPAHSRPGFQYGSRAYIPSDQNRFDDLEFDRYTDFHQSTRQLSEATSDTLNINNALDMVRDSFETLFDRQRTLVEEMQEKLMQIRMVEFGTVATRLQRVVTVACEDEEKKVRLSIENEKLELDTQILEALTEPLMHLLKNAVVHGIESPDTRRLLGKPEVGEIKLRVVNEDTHVLLTLSDDGRGIAVNGLKEKAIEGGHINRAQAVAKTDDQLFELMFLPGVTTAEKLNLSAGRGVGMSIVRQSIEARKGTVSVRSSPQSGTSFSLRVPLTLAVTNVLLVRSGPQISAIPLKVIKHIGEIEGRNIAGDESVGFAIESESFLSPLKFLADLIGQQLTPDLSAMTLNTIRVETDSTAFVIAVDEILRTEEVVIKPLGRPLENIKGILGAAILGNGELVSILDLPYLLHRETPQPKKREAPQMEHTELTVMIVDDSPSVRHMTSKIIDGAGWSFTTAKDGLDALEQLKLASKLPNVILSDIEMPRMDGYEFVSALRRSASFAHIPVVMITSRASEKHRDKAFAAGVSEYLPKPYVEKELLDTIRKLATVAAY